MTSAYVRAGQVFITLFLDELLVISGIV